MFPHFKIVKTAQISLYNNTSNAQRGNRFAQLAHVRIIREFPLLKLSQPEQAVQDSV